MKDIRVINRPLNSMILVDNSTCSFGFQLSNGVPILPFTGDSTDSELLLLAEYLQYLLDKPDIRVCNKEHFKFHQYIGCESMQATTARIFKNDD